MRTAIALIVAATAGPSLAQNMTGNALLYACTEKEAELSGYCAGYITGITEGLRFGVGWPLMAGGGKTSDEVNQISDTLLMYCPHAEITGGQFLDVVVKYLTKNPETRHHSARGLVLDAYQEAFPCPAP